MVGDQRQRVEEYPFQDTTEIIPKKGMAQHPLVVVALMAAIAGLLYLAYRSSSDSSVASEGTESAAVESESTDEVVEGDGEVAGPETAAADEGDDADGSDDAAAETEDEATGDDSGTLDLGPSLSIPAPEEGAYVAARLNLDAEPGNGLFVLSGRVPDAETAAAVTRAAEISYAPYVQSELTIDETLEPAPWLAAAPNVVGLLPSVTDGTVMVVDQKILLSARSPNLDYLANLQGALKLLGGGLPLEMFDAKITDLTAPVFTTEVVDGTITLSGAVPSDEIVQLLAGGAAAAYGPENVVNELTVDPRTYRSFWMETTPAIYQLFRAFPRYNFTVQDGQFSGSLQGGVNFAADSTEISEAAAQALDIGIAILARDISVGMLITGHTDAQGPDEYNQALSLARAQSVVDYMAAGGIDPARLVAAGAGESQPIGDNETEEGRALNRRVEFQFGPASSLAGG